MNGEETVFQTMVFCQDEEADATFARGSNDKLVSSAPFIRQTFMGWKV